MTSRFRLLASIVRTTGGMAVAVSLALSFYAWGGGSAFGQVEPLGDSTEESLKKSSSPNIIVVMADDMGYSDLGCYGSEIETPHLDRLAENGVRMTQFYNTSRCCPTRAALLTGVYSHQAGIGHMVHNHRRPGYQGFLNDRCVTIAEALAPAGYTTLMAGKWHVGSNEEHWPTERGFDKFFGTPIGGGVYFKDSLQIRDVEFFVRGNERVPFPEDGYVTDLFTDYALQFIRGAADQERPFFLYLAHIAPHWPLQAKPEDIQKYRGRYDVGWDAIRQARYEKQQDLGLIDADWPLSPRDAQPWEELTKEQRHQAARRMEVYAAQIDSIDQNLGRLLAQLEELKLLDNTLILFLSDNGCSAEGGPGGFNRGKPGAPLGSGLSYASVGREWANVANTPFRKYKMQVHEGGISSPLIAHWPAGLKRRGALETQPGHVIDILPTCLDVAGAEYPQQRDGEAILPVEGRSLLPVLRGEPIEREALFWEHQGNRAVRVGDWKLVASHGRPWELYNLKDDRTELNNRAKAEPARVRELAARWQAWADRSGVEPWPLRARKPGPSQQ